MSKPPRHSLEVLLKSANPGIRQYVVNLEAINANLQKRIVAYEAEKVSQDNKIIALEKQRDGFKALLDKRGPAMQLVLNRPGKHS